MFPFTIIYSDAAEEKYESRLTASTAAALCVGLWLQVEMGWEYQTDSRCTATASIQLLQKHLKWPWKQFKICGNQSLLPSGSKWVHLWTRLSSLKGSFRDTLKRTSGFCSCPKREIIIKSSCCMVSFTNASQLRSELKIRKALPNFCVQNTTYTYKCPINKW